MQPRLTDKNPTTSFIIQLLSRFLLPLKALSAELCIFTIFPSLPLTFPWARPSRPTSLSVHWSDSSEGRSEEPWSYQILWSLAALTCSPSQQCWMQLTTSAFLKQFWASVYSIILLDCPPLHSQYLFPLLASLLNVVGLRAQGYSSSLVKLILSQDLSTIYLLMIHTFLSSFPSLPVPEVSTAFSTKPPT